MIEISFNPLRALDCAFTDRNSPAVENLVSSNFFPLYNTATMMNFRVAPNLPMSFGFHGDLHVLTKRTI
jgi:hypothetical protein